MVGLGHCGCAADHMPGLGAIDNNGFVTLGATPSTGSELPRDLAVGAFAFVAPWVYDKTAPKKWPHAKKLWQDIAVVVGCYFLGSYLVRRVL